MRRRPSPALDALVREARAQHADRTAAVVAAVQARCPELRRSQVTGVLDRLRRDEGPPGAAAAPRATAGQATPAGVALTPDRDPTTERRWSERADGTADLALTTDREVRTLADLCAVCAIDADAWDVVEWTANAWQMGAKVPGPDGEPTLAARTLYQIKARLRRKDGPSTREQIDAMVAGALAARASERPRLRVRVPAPSALLQALCIADPHLAKYAHHPTTGHGNYDLSIARDGLVAGGTYLIAAGAARGVTERVVAFLGDYFHYDTPAGTTTGGTALDRDSRVQRMLEVGTEAACAIIAASAETARTRVVIVPGNHDEVLTYALQRILWAEFKGHPNVTVQMEYTRRQYLLWGRNLLGFAHGDKRPETLAASMAIERPDEWGRSVYREIHTGHLHNEREKQKLVEYRGTVTHEGVIVRTHRSIAPADDWHAAHGFVGAPKGTTAWLYHADGGLVGSDVADPRLLAPVPSLAA